MKIKTLIVIVFLYPIILLGQGFENGDNSKENTYKVVGYIPKSRMKDITSSTFRYVTEVIYFGTDFNGIGNIETKNVEKDLIRLDSLRLGRSVKISVCFGGAGRSDFFAEMTASKKKRQNFCDQALDLCQKYKLNGIDIDWEFPDDKVKKQNFVHLIEDLHKTLSPHEIGISIAVGSWRKQAKLAASVEPYITGVNLMVYDNHSHVKGHTSYSLMKKTCNRFIHMGIPSKKLLIGVPFYGRHRWKYSKTMAYREVKKPQDNISTKGIYNGYFFDVPATLQKKIKYVQKTNKGGIMIWELGQDLSPEQEHSLLRYIWNSLNIGSSDAN